jgi:hypothetical protein
MLRELMETQVTAVKNAVHLVREWVHPTMVMKRHDFDCPLDDLGQPLEDVEQRAEPRNDGRA